MRLTSPLLKLRCMCVCVHVFLCMCESVICSRQGKNIVIIYPRWSDLSVEVLDGWIVLLHEMPRHELHSECRLSDATRAEDHHLELLHDWLGVLSVTAGFYWICHHQLQELVITRWLTLTGTGWNEQLLILKLNSLSQLSHLVWQRISWGGPRPLLLSVQSFINNNNLSWSPTTPCPACCLQARNPWN